MTIRYIVVLLHSYIIVVQARRMGEKEAGVGE